MCGCNNMGDMSQQEISAYSLKLNSLFIPAVSISLGNSPL